MTRFVCLRCGKSCHNAGGLATHMKTHDKSFVESPSLLRFIKRAPQKPSIELKPLKPKPVQSKLSAKPRSNVVAPSSPQMLRDPPLQVAPPRPRLPRTKASDSDLSHFLAPPNITASDLDKRSPEFRVAHVRYFKKLKREKFPMMDKKAYHAANESSLGVKLRRFQQWFACYDNDVKKIRVNAEPKPEKLRHQNKVVTQGARTRFTPRQKLDFITEFERLKQEEPALTQSAFCSTRTHLKESTFSKWFKPMERKRIEIDARNPQLRNSRWSSNGANSSSCIRHIYMHES